MSQEHWRLWHCPFGCHQTYSTAGEFEEHVKQAHHSEAEAQNFDSLRVLSGHSDPKQAQGLCPLCVNFQILSDRHYSSHVGGHLESLALFALPDTGVEREGSGLDSDSSEADLKRDDMHDARGGPLQRLYYSDSDLDHEGKLHTNPGNCGTPLSACKLTNKIRSC